MFSGLSQGNLIHILDKTNRPVLKIGEIVGVSYPDNNYNFTTIKPENKVVDIKVKIDNDVVTYQSIPSNYSVVSYNNGQVIISENKQGLQNEVESLLRSNQNIVNNIDTYKQNVIDYENILKDLNPGFAKDKERDNKIEALEAQVGDISGKLDKILDAMFNK